MRTTLAVLAIFYPSAVRALDWAPSDDDASVSAGGVHLYPTCTVHQGSVHAVCNGASIFRWGIGPEGEAQAVVNCNYAAQIDKKWGACLPPDGDDCVGVVCGGGGTCTDAVREFTCRCAPGWQGGGVNAVCTDKNECEGDPCGQGGTCNNGLGVFTCSCDAGFTSGGEKPDTPCSEIGGRDGKCAQGLPVDCVVSTEWSWGSCSSECGEGTSARTRTVTVEPCNDGQPCPPLSQSTDCMNRACDCDKVHPSASRPPIFSILRPLTHHVPHTLPR